MRHLIHPTAKTSLSPLFGLWVALTLVAALQLVSLPGFAQACPTSGTHTQTSVNENTYFPGTSAAVAAGATSISLGAVPSGYGSSPIAVGDFLLIIQMQGANIYEPTVSTDALYGGNFSGAGAGFITTNLSAGQMEFAIAANAVGTGGGTLTISAGLTYAYSSSAYNSGTGVGQYTYQIIRVPQYYNLQLGGTIPTPKWNGAVGGVTVVDAVNQLDFNGATITASGKGFRGGGGRRLTGSSSTNKADFYTVTTQNVNGSKGEGIAGTPRFINNGTLLDNIVEGYYVGSYGRGAPGNAGGGANDSDPASNDQNAGGGGGGNGGAGGLGGNGWYSFGATGGRGGTPFRTTGPTKIWYSPGRLVMGGGAGAGTSNDGTGTPGSGFATSGSAGGGIVIVTATTIINSGTIDVSGLAGNSTVVTDGSGGGGAGGSVLIYASSGQSGITAIANGGKGGDNHPGGATQHGPGGGGGGGVVYSNNALNVASAVAGGLSGFSYGSGTITDSAYGAKPGAVGVLSATATFSSLPPNMQICQVTVLPVNLVNFTATYVAANNVTISWTTTAQVNSDYFLVERSTTGTDFGSIGRVEASNSYETEHNYSLTDDLAGVTGSIVYYRLKIVDRDGRFSYSKIIPIRLDASATSLQLYPNPAASSTILNLHADKPGYGIYRIVDNAGRTIASSSFVANTGTNKILIDNLGGLPRGMYFVQVVLNNTLYNQKLVKK